MRLRQPFCPIRAVLFRLTCVFAAPLRLRRPVRVRWAAVIPIVTSLLVVPSAAGGQETSAPERGRFSISLAVAEGGQIGIWGRVRPGVDAGLNFGASYEDIRDEQGSERIRLLALEPAVKVGLAPEGSLIPYVFGSVFGEDGRTRIAATVGGATAVAMRTRWRTGVAIGAGMDWFPVSRLSVGGHVGARASRASTTLTIDGVREATGSRNGTSLSTFSSGVRAHLYF
jgi:opacity protein-like surface antigen